MSERNSIEHAPRYKYDCAHCKFSWCCGYLCACALTLGGDSILPPSKKLEGMVNRLQDEWRSTLSQHSRDYFGTRVARISGGRTQVVYVKDIKDRYAEVGDPIRFRGLSKKRWRKGRVTALRGSVTYISMRRVA